MLQIITGKFFKSAERLEHPGKGVLYSNYSWVGPIETSIGTLEPIDPYQAASTQYVFSYTNQIEKEEPKPGVIVRVGDSEILRQFQLLSMFGLRACFSVDRASVVERCRTKPKHGGSSVVPSRFVPRLFKEHIHGTPQEVGDFAAFVSKVLALPRDRYLAVIAVLDNLEHALLALDWNVSLAYSILVYCLESLSQGFDGYVPVWSDYGHAVRKRIDSALSEVEVGLQSQIRNALLDDAFIKLQGRVVEFTERSLTEEHFIEPRLPAGSLLRRSDLRRALRNAYELRSKYAHALQPIQEHLHHADLASHEVFRWEKEPFLTFGGLYRIVDAVVRNFIDQSPGVASESIDWRGDLPGILRMQVSPEYWIWNANGIEGLSGEALAERVSQLFGGFLVVLAESLEHRRPLVDMQAVFAKLVEKIPQSARQVRLRVLVMVVLYNGLLRAELQMSQWRSIVEKWEREFASCTVETMIAKAILGDQLAYPVSECISAYEKFCQERFGKLAFLLPPVLELMLQVTLANAALDSGDVGAFVGLLTVAIGDMGARPAVQSKLIEARDAGVRVKLDEILSFVRSRERPVTAKPESPSASAEMTELPAASSNVSRIESAESAPDREPEDPH